MPHRLVVVDGCNILFRAFFGVRPLSTSQGVPTNAVYGFATMLLRLMEQPDTTALVAVFDAPARTFRHDADINYKATRAPFPDGLAPQIPLAKELLAAFDLSLLMETGVEADDVIGTIACRSAESGWDVGIVTSDGDACQLVDDHIQVLCPRNGSIELAVMDREAVCEKYGVCPAQLPDWKALAGDSSDNIPGVPGIGPRTATSLLKQFGTLESLYSRLDEVPNARCRGLLADHREKAFLSQHLARIRTDLALEVDPEKWRVPQPDLEKLHDLFTRLEFRSLLRRFSPSPAPQGAPRVVSSPAAHQDYGCITAAELPAFLDDHQDFSDPRPVALHLAESGHALPLVAVSPAPGIARFLPPEEVERARGILEDPAILKTAHDAKSAINRLFAAGITLNGLWIDTSIASYLLNPGRGHHRVDEVVFECLGVELERAPLQPSLFEENSQGEDAGIVLCREVDCIAQLCDPLLQRVQNEQMAALLEDVEMPLVPILASLERLGVAVDVSLLHELSTKMAGEIAFIEKEIFELAGCSFTINSPKQLQEVLFGKLQLAKGKATRTGYSTDAETLKSLAADHPLPGRVLAYRELARLKSTYTDAIPRLVRPETGRVHT